MNWEPTELTITTYVCMGTGKNYLAELEESL